MPTLALYTKIYSIIIKTSPFFIVIPSFAYIFFIVPLAEAFISFINFIASTIQSVSPYDTLSPSFT